MMPVIEVIVRGAIFAACVLAAWAIICTVADWVRGNHGQN